MKPTWTISSRSTIKSDIFFYLRLLESWIDRSKKKKEKEKFESSLIRLKIKLSSLQPFSLPPFSIPVIFYFTEQKTHSTKILTKKIGK